MKKFPTPLLLGFLLGLTVGSLLWHYVVAARLRAEREQWQARAEQAEALHHATTTQAGEGISADELKRLRDSQTELLRLRGQVGQLRRDLQGATNALKAAQAPAGLQPEIPPGPEAMRIEFTNRVESVLGWGQTLISGGWEMPNGKRGYVLAQPQPVSTDQDQILIKTQILEVPSSVVKDVGLEVDATTGAQIFSTDAAANLMKRLAATDGVDVLTAPQIQTLTGRQAQVQVTDVHTAPSGENYTTGPIIDIFPTITADRQSVAVIISSSLSVERNQPK